MESGQVLAGRYLVQNRIGKGQGGVVYACLDTQTNTRVAIKTHATQRPGMFDIERTALRALEHPHLLRMLDAGIDGTTTFVVSELASGGSLEDLAKPLPPEMLRTLAEQLLQALGFLHGQEILHGDVKTENILIASLERPVFKLGDFGLARRTKDAALGLLGASPAFMAPELIRGSIADERSDLYALGITLYECAFGVLPFVDTNPKALQMRHLTEEPPHFAAAHDLPSRFIELLRKLLAKEPAARPSNALEALAYWRGEESAVPQWVPQRLGVLIGREPELSVLEQAAAEPFAVVAIGGPPGIGKTRLLQELALRRELRGTPSFWWGPDGLSGKFGASSLLEERPVQTATLDSTTDRVKEMALQRAAALAERLGTGPWVLILDDIDSAPAWFHDAAGSFVRGAASDDGTGRLVCVSGRDQALELTRSWLEAGELESPREVRLEAWGDEDLHGALSALFGARAVDAALVAAVREASGGVPSDVEAAAQQLVAKQLLRVDPAGAITVAPDIRPDQLIGSARTWIAAALESRTAAERKLLNALAFLRSPASMAFLERLDENPAAKLTALVRHGLVSAQTIEDVQYYAVVSAAVRAAITKQIATEALRKGHDRIADVLDAHPNLAPSEDTDFHRASGSDLKRAYVAVETLASRARPEIVADLCGTLLDAWPAAHDPASRVRVILWQLEALRHLGALDAVVRLGEAALPSATDPEIAQAIRNRVAEALLCRAESERALELLAVVSPGPLAADASALRARAFSNLGLHARAATICETTLRAISPENPAYDAIVEAWALSLTDLGRARDAEDPVRDLVRRREPGGPSLAVATHVTTLGNVVFYQGRFREAETVFLRAHSMLVALGDRLGLVRVLNGLAASTAELGRFTEARKRLLEAIHLCRRLGDPAALAYSHTNLAHFSLPLARYAEGLQHAASGEQLAERLNDLPNLIGARKGRAWIWARLGQDERAEQDARWVLGQSPGGIDAGHALMTLFEVALNRETLDVAKAKLDEAAAIFEAIGAADESIHALVARARLAVGTGEHGTAVELAHDAIGQAEAVGIYLARVGAKAVLCEAALGVDPGAAAQLATELLNEVLPAGLRETAWQLQHVLARSAMQQHDCAGAKAYYQQALVLLQAIATELPAELANSYLDRPDTRRLLDEFSSL